MESKEKCVQKCSICGKETNRLFVYESDSKNSFIKVCESCEEANSNYSRKKDAHYIGIKDDNSGQFDKYWYYGEAIPSDYEYPEAKKVVLILEGGVVQEIYCTDQDMKVVIIDHDTKDGGDDEEIAEYIDKIVAFDSDKEVSQIY
jgi:hypothetical protein